MPPVVFEPEVVRLPLALEIFLTVWFFCLGACVGSFLNVVIYRLPRGKSVVTPASSCPGCGSAIRSRDNLPILSWLLLRGRCRNCQMPISVRYPIVELIFALLFMAMAAQALASNGPWWLLNFVPGTFLGIEWPRLALAYVHYMLLVSTLICAAYIAWDGEAAPLRLYLPAFVVGTAVTLYWNEIRPLSTSPNDAMATINNGLWEGLAGAALGLVLGILFDTVLSLHDYRGEPRGQTRVALAMCGWMLGSKPVPIVVAAGAIVALVWFVISGRRWRSAVSAPLVGIAVATTVLVLAGRLLFDHWPLWRLSERTLAVASAVIALAVAAVLRRLAPAPELPPPPAIEMTPPTPDVMYP